MIESNNNPDCMAKLNILYVGIGNLLRKDDGVGVYVCERIQTNSIVKKINAEASIENYIGKINELAPDLLILIDCVDFGREPGYYNLIPAGKLYGSIINTHNISLKNISSLFTMPVWILGIQPASLRVAEGLTEEVKLTADHLVDMINLWTQINYSPIVPGKIFVEE